MKNLGVLIVLLTCVALAGCSPSESKSKPADAHNHSDHQH